ncbi:MAG: alpha/beta hydrolase family protein [Acidimicrobiales bacterium]
MSRNRTTAGARGRRIALRLAAGFVALGVAAGALVAESDIAHARGASSAAESTVNQKAAQSAEPEPVAATTPSTRVTTTTTSTALPAPVLVAVGAIGTYQTTTSDITVVDPSRSTPDRGSMAGHPGRTLRTLVITPSVSGGGKFPVIVFAHGYDSEPETYLRLLQAWASAGYLVLAPESPGSAANLLGSPVRSDIGGQAQDLSFVITKALSGTFGSVDPARVTVAGHSDGGSAIATLALNVAYHDPRIANYIVLSGAIPDDVGGTWGTAPESGRLLVVVGDQDEYSDLPASTGVYDTATMAKTLAIAPGGDHLDTYLAATSLANDVRAETVAFLAGRSAPGQLELTSHSAA